MRARTLQRIWNKFHIAIGIGFAVAILLLCSRMLYLAYSKQPILAVARYVGWVIYDSHPRWFVTSVVAYCLILVLSLIWAIAGYFATKFWNGLKILVHSATVSFDAWFAQKSL